MKIVIRGFVLNSLFFLLPISAIPNENLNQLDRYKKNLSIRIKKFLDCVQKSQSCSQYQKEIFAIITIMTSLILTITGVVLYHHKKKQSQIASSIIQIPQSEVTVSSTIYDVQSGNEVQYQKDVIQKVGEMPIVLSDLLYDTKYKKLRQAFIDFISIEQQQEFFNTLSSHMNGSGFSNEEIKKIAIAYLVHELYVLLFEEPIQPISKNSVEKIIKGIMNHSVISKQQRQTNSEYALCAKPIEETALKPWAYLSCTNSNIGE